MMDQERYNEGYFDALQDILDSIDDDLSMDLDELRDIIGDLKIVQENTVEK